MITPPMVRALDGFDDHFRIEARRGVLEALVRYGLAEQRGLGYQITRAGLNALCLFPNPPQHKIGYVHGSVPVKGTERYAIDGRLVANYSMLFSAWCSCGQFRYDGEEMGRRAAVKRHKLEAGE